MPSVFIFQIKKSPTNTKNYINVKKKSYAKLLYFPLSKIVSCSIPAKNVLTCLLKVTAFFSIEQ